MKEVSLDKLLPKTLRDMLNVYHEYMFQANDINNKIINNERTTNVK